MQFDFSGASDCLLILDWLLYSFWLFEEVKGFYLCLHLGWNLWIILFENRDNFTSFFPIWMPFIYFFLIWVLLLVLPGVCCIEGVRVRILALYQISQEKHEVFPHWLKCQLWVFHKWSLLYWDKFLLYLFCWEFLSCMEVELFQGVFLYL